MFRVDNATAAAALPTPGAVGPNPDSFFTDGDPVGGTPATVVPADWLNAVQEEISHVIEQAGDTLDKDDRTQLYAAIQALIAAGMSPQSLIVCDQKAQGTNAGASTAAGVQTRTLNTVEKNTITGASLGSNRITLPAGTYRIRAYVPAYNANGHRAYLYNFTDSAVTILGSNENSTTSGAADGVHSNSIIDGEFTISGTKSFEIRHYTVAAEANYGLGLAMNVAGFVEQYTRVVINKL